jgi:hypothetical protein
MDRFDCKEGEAAYCCGALEPPPPNPAPNWEPALTAFQRELDL